MRKLIAFSIAVAMIIAISVPAFAAELNNVDQTSDLLVQYEVSEGWTASIPSQIEFDEPAAVGITATALDPTVTVAVKVSTADGAWTLDYYGHDGLEKVAGIDPLTYAVTGSTKGAIANGGIVASISVESGLTVSEDLTFTVPTVPKVAGIYKDIVTFTVFYAN